MHGQNRQFRRARPPAGTDFHSEPWLHLAKLRIAHRAEVFSIKYTYSLRHAKALFAVIFSALLACEKESLNLVFNR